LLISQIKSYSDKDPSKVGSSPKITVEGFLPLDKVARLAIAIKSPIGEMAPQS